MSGLRVNDRKRDHMELNFRKPELADRDLIQKYFSAQKSRSCEMTFANLYLWARHYKVEYTIVEDMLVFCYPGKTMDFVYPKGRKENRKKVLDLLMEWCRENQKEFRLTLVTPEQFAELEEMYPGKFVIEYYRDSADYVYETEKLIRLSGKKYHGKKNHINRFMKTYPDWTYETIDDHNVEECFQMALDWRRENGCEEDPEKNAEMCVTMNALRLREELDLRGGLLRAGGKVVAFSLGEPVCDDTMVVHIEKAYADIPGAYPMINQQYLMHEASGYLYVNREEDTGDPGLRQAKLSYHPVFLIEKGIASFA